MARPRSELSSLLHTFCSNVYFQPPADKKLTYPCIIYSLDALNVLYADNGPYRLHDRYSITYITRDPDDENIRKFVMLPLCKFDRSYSSDNLHHYAYTIFI